MVSVNDRGRVVGQDHHRSKLSDHEVDLVHELDAEGLKQSVIADKMEISRALVSYILSGKRRGHMIVGQRIALPARPRLRFRPASIDEFEFT